MACYVGHVLQNGKKSCRKTLKKNFNRTPTLQRLEMLGINLYTENFGTEINRRFPNLFFEHVNWSISIAFIPRLNFKLLFCVHSSKFGKCLYQCDFFTYTGILGFHVTS